eukprot:SAG11_NODE_199_length_12635_cov_104.801771_3_plen_69_part_00
MVGAFYVACIVCILYDGVGWFGTASLPLLLAVVSVSVFTEPFASNRAAACGFSAACGAAIACTGCLIA